MSHTLAAEIYCDSVSNIKSKYWVTSGKVGFFYHFRHLLSFDLCVIQGIIYAVKAILLYDLGDIVIKGKKSQMAVLIAGVINRAGKRENDALREEKSRSGQKSS